MLGSPPSQRAASSLRDSLRLPAMSEEEYTGFRQMQTAFREPLLVPTFLLAVLSMVAFVVWDVARQGGWSTGANTRVIGAGAALLLLWLLRTVWRPSLRVQSLCLYVAMYFWQLGVGLTFGPDTLMQFPGLLIIMFASVFALVRAKDAWINLVLIALSVPLVLPVAATAAQWMYVLGLYGCVALLAWVNSAQRERTAAVIFLSKTQWKRVAQTDVVTGLPSRRTFEMFMEREAWRLGARPATLALAIIDIDHFKQVNDLYGHDVGDNVLREVAARLKACVREVDLLARMGGEEFGLAMLDIPPDKAVALLDRLKDVVASRPFVVGERKIRCTVSAGLTDGALADASWESLYQRADQALYEAKTLGRNQVVARLVGAPA